MSKIEGKRTFVMDDRSKRKIALDPRMTRAVVTVLQDVAAKWVAQTGGVTVTQVVR